MSFPVSLSLDNLKQLVQVIKDIATIQLDATARDAIKQMSEEVSNSCKTIKNSLTPFARLDPNRESFKDDFDDAYGKYVNAYVNNEAVVRTSCEKVKNHLTRIIGDQQQQNNGDQEQEVYDKSVYQKIREKLNKRNLDDLRRLRDSYKGADYALEKELRNLLDDTYNTLSEIKSKLEDQDMAIKVQGKQQFINFRSEIVFKLIENMNVPLSDLDIALDKFK